MTRAHRASVPPELQPDEPHSAVAFAVDGVDASAAATTWAREVFAGAPTAIGWMLFLSWRFGLGLRLASINSPDHVLGWDLISTGPMTATLCARSWLLDASNTVQVSEGRLVWTTVVVYRHAVGRIVWPAALPVHRLILGRLLDRAASRRAVQA